MLGNWRHQHRLRRVQEGNGGPLKPFRWWQLGRRSLFHLRLADAGTWSVDVRTMGDASDGVVRARLYRDGREHAVSKVPAVFAVPGGRIEVATSTAGVKRCHFVQGDVASAGAERPLVPDPGSAEGRRARLERNHPVLSRWIGVISVLALVLGVGLNLLQLLEPLSRIPPIAENLGTFTSPISLPLWLNIALAVAAVLGTVERSLRMRHHWLLDGLGT